MANKRSLWSQKILDECRDDWRPMEEVILAAMPTVPPGKALRFYESRDRIRKGVRPLTEDEKIRSGQRHYTINALRALTIARKIETQSGMIRLAQSRPEIIPLDVCPHCLRPYDQKPEEVASDPFPIASSMGRQNVIYPRQFNKRRFG